MSEDQAPSGYHYEWRPERSWSTESIFTFGKKCRRHGCPNPPIAALDRGHRKMRWWPYCADHMYGRKLQNGVVLRRCLVENEGIEQTT